MLKFFFNRSSYAVRLMEVLGITTSCFYFYKNASQSTIWFWLFLFLFMTTLFVHICDLIPWHGAQKRSVGIRVHFQKSLVPTSYILAITSLLCFFNVFILAHVILILAILMMLVIAPVNGILIYFYFHDKDPLPINYFSSNYYLRGDTALPLTTPSGGPGLDRSLR